MISHVYLRPSTWAALFRPSLVAPDIRVKSINEIDIKKLKDRKIKNIIFDIDHTLSAYHADFPSILIKARFEELKKGFRCIALTNFIHSDDPARIKERLSAIKKGFGIRAIIPKDKKPSPKAFLGALKAAGFTKKDTVVIGDRVIADIIGANRTGLMSIQVSPLHIETMPVFYRSITVIEHALYRTYLFLGLIKEK